MPRAKSKIVDVNYDEADIKERYLLPFVPSYLYGPDDFKVVSVHKETFENGVSRSIIVYKKKDVNRPGKYIVQRLYDDWQLPETKPS